MNVIHKGPVKLIKGGGGGGGIAHSFLQSVSDQFPHYHFKLAYVILQTSVREFFETHF